MVKLKSIRVVLELVSNLNLGVKKLHMKIAFLHVDLEEDIHTEQHEGFKVKGKKELVCRLKKILYDLNQANSVTMIQ